MEDAMLRNRRIDVPEDKLRELCERYKVKELSVFGSVLRDDFGPDSDIDVLVEFEPGPAQGLFAFIRLQRELSELLGRKVDLVPKKGLKWVIRDHVLESAEVIFPIPRSSVAHLEMAERTESRSSKSTDL